MGVISDLMRHPGKLVTSHPDALLRDIRAALPAGWKGRLAGAWSEQHDCIMWTLWLDEPSMGWSTWLMDADPKALKGKAKAYVDECLADCVPDQGSDDGSR